MHYYQLEDKSQDALFLRGEPLRCRAAFTSKDISNGVTEPGKPIMIILSNGEKYMGRVVKFHTNVSTAVPEGILEIIRYQKT